MHKIDTHQHLLYPEKFGYAWTKELPALRGAFPLENYWLAAEGCGVDGTLFMEVDADEDQSGREARFFCELAADSAHRIRGVIAAARPEGEGFDAYLESIAHPKLKGIRRVLHTQPDALMENPRLRENLRRLPAHGLPFDLCVLQRQLPQAGALVGECPETQFILDHCAVPEIAEDGWKSWAHGIRRLAEFPNVACKISGLVAYAAEEQLTAAGLLPYVETAIEAFGWERVVWGGDWPVCTLTSTFRQWVEILDEILRPESPDHLRRLYRDNAERFYQLES